ncbi:MAG: histidine phosphatase family protein [Bacteroidaceae bacterium]|nr:histidine phosphatase family protein [Bacteroidaceae bacterium]
MNKLELCLVRHGETEENVARILQGHLPGVLTSAGRQQVEQLRATVNVEDYDAVCCSDLQRVVDTVEILMRGRCAIPIFQTRLLREIDWGSMTGMKIEDIDLKRLAPDVETREMLYHRAADAIEFVVSTARSIAATRVLVVSHGLMLRSLVAHLTHVPVEGLKTIEHFKNCEARIFTVCNVLDGSDH